MKKITRIYELGTAHCKSIEKAKKMIDLIAEYDPGSWVKIQYFNNPHNFIAKNAIFKSGQNQIAIANSHRLSQQKATQILQYARQKQLKAGASFYCSNDLGTLEVDFIKVASPDAVDFRLLDIARRIPSLSSLHTPVFISIGGMSLGELHVLVDSFAELHQFMKRVTFLNCVSEYPQSPNFGHPALQKLGYLKSKQKKYGYALGYSDHSAKQHWENICTMTMMGCTVFEKHVELPGEKHIDSAVCMSLTKHEIEKFRAMTKFGSILNTAQEIAKCAFDKDMLFTRKYWVAFKPIKIGDVFTEANITLKRCMTKNLYEKCTTRAYYDPQCKPPYDRLLCDGSYDIIGMKATRNIRKEEVISTECAAKDSN